MTDNNLKTSFSVEIMDKFSTLGDNVGRNIRKDINGNICRTNPYTGNMQGRVIVETFDHDTGEKKVLHDKNNLIVYRGRAWSLLRLFNAVPDVVSSEDRDVWKGFYLSLFGIGNGGTASASPINPLSVRPSSSGFGGNALSITNDVDGEGSAPYYVYDSVVYKKFDDNNIILLHDEELYSGNPTEYAQISGETFAEGTNNYKADSFLIAKCVLTLSQIEGNGTSGGSQNISQVGIFASDLDCATSNTLKYAPVLFAQVNTQVIVKTSAQDLTYTWYVFL